MDNLGHGFLIRFLLRLGPLHNHLRAPDLQVGAGDGAPCGRRRLVAVVVQECKAAVELAGVVRRVVDDYVN